MTASVSVRRARRLTPSLALVAAAAVALAGCLGADTPPFAIARMKAATPSCDLNPTYPWIGRVAGKFIGSSGLSQSHGTSGAFVGCFPDLKTCNLWRDYAISFIASPLSQNVCERRST
ncbi:hypothetical protein [Segnochrobactrum spirostomi]|uniref:Lipoprotein n=1 Tax=Segnochrobactrum spirostomi TaxID=2608987 RepID=A0A6A7Y0I5_9HYPH|nr:hypothetical protein [Segnochrobactrum spirostomi]MQT12255.1 hypothetical protein [Segnochrobactrum spirostomi]